MGLPPECGRMASRRLALVAITLALLALAPAVEASLVLKDRSPVPKPTPWAPQLYCVTVFEKPEKVNCLNEGPASGVSHVRVRVQGQAEARVLVDRIGGDGVHEQLAYFTCARSCLVPLKNVDYGTTGYGRYVFQTGEAGAVVTVTLEDNWPFPLA